MKIYNGTHDFTERDKSVKTWHDLKDSAQMTIFERQEQRRKQYEFMLFKRAIWDFFKYAVPLGALVLIAFKYSNEISYVLTGRM